MPFDSAEDRQYRAERAQRRQDMAAIRARLRSLEPGQPATVPWIAERDRGGFRRDVVWVAYLLWGRRAASVVPVERGCLVTRHG